MAFLVTGNSLLILAAEGNRLILVKNDVAVGDSINALRVRFLFRTDDWAPLFKMAVFSAGGDHYIVPPDADGECIVPWHVLENSESFETRLVGLGYGVKKPTNMLSFRVNDGVELGGDEPPDIDNATVVMLMAAIDQKQDKLTAGQNVSIVGDVVSAEIPEIPTDISQLTDNMGLLNTQPGNVDPESRDKSYTHEQTSASEVWDITHNLRKYPSVTVVDSAESVVFGDVEYLTVNTARVTFTGAFSGRAYLN
jgi:hypothetical protein